MIKNRNMKTIKILILIGFLVGLLSCHKNDTEEISNPDVGNYIVLLKADSYEFSTLPAFSPKDIPALMVYINDNSVVDKFPYNLISSYGTPPNPNYRLGVLVLWTIESIRVATRDNKLSPLFPSQNPFLQTKSEPIEWFIDHDNEAYETVRQAYSNWWNENKHKNINSFCSIDPLENTNYRWQ